MKSDRSNAAILALAVGALLLFVGGGARFAISLTLRPIDAEFAGGRSLVGSAVFLFQFVSAVAMVYAGRLADRHDVRLVLGAGVLIGAIGLAGMALAGSPLQILILYGVVFGLGSGIASLIPVGIMATRAFPDRIGVANAVMLAGMGLGQLVMLSVLSGTVTSSGWRQVYVVLALTHAVLLPLLLVGGGTSGRGNAASQASGSTGGMSLAKGARTGRFWVLIVLYALCGLEDFFVTTHIVAFAQDHGANALFAGNLLAAMGLMMLLGVLVSGWASDRFGPVVPTLAAFALRVVLFAAVLLDKSTITVALFALLFGSTFLVTAPLCVVFCRAAFGVRNLGLFTGLITMVHQIAGGLGAWAGAVWFDTSGNYQAILAVMLASSIAGVALAMRLRERFDVGSRFA